MTCIKRELLSIRRLIDQINPLEAIPQNSLTAVGFDREKFEEIRKGKRLSIQSIESKINLSRSRYYRWLAYEIDLPMELLIGLKKLLGLSDLEFKSLIISSTDEIFHTLVLVLYYSLSKQKDSKQKLKNVRKGIEKYRRTSVGTEHYKLILNYIDLVNKEVDLDGKKSATNQLRLHFSRNEYISLFDVLLFLGILRYTINEDITDTNIEKYILLFVQFLNNKTWAQDFATAHKVINAIIMDYSLCLYDLKEKEIAGKLITAIINKKNKESYIDKYSRLLYEILVIKYTSSIKLTQDSVLADVRKTIESSISILPEYEIEFVRKIFTL